MLKFLVLSVLLGIVASETDIFGDHEYSWYPLRLYGDVNGPDMSCYILKFKNLKSTCTCNGVAVSTVSLQIVDAPDSPPIPYVLLEEEDNIADVLRLKCTCPKKSLPVHLAFKPLTDDNFMIYVSARGPEEGLLMGSENMSEADLDKFVKGVDELKNLNNYVNICIAGKESTGEHKKWSLFPSTA